MRTHGVSTRGSIKENKQQRLQQQTMITFMNTVFRCRPNEVILTLLFSTRLDMLPLPAHVPGREGLQTKTTDFQLQFLLGQAYSINSVPYHSTKRRVAVTNASPAHAHTQDSNGIFTKQRLMSFICMCPTAQVTAGPAATVCSVVSHVTRHVGATLKWCHWTTNGMC